MKAPLSVLLVASSISAQELIFTPDGFSFSVQSPWEFLASSSPNGPWTVIRELQAGEAAQYSPATSQAQFFRARTIGFERSAKAPCPTPAKIPVEPAVDLVYFSAYASDTRYETMSQNGSTHWYRNTEQWAGGNLATYRYSTSGNDMCPTGGVVCFEYAAPTWDRRLLFTNGCDLAMYPGMAAQFSMDWTLAAITNKTEWMGVRDTAEANISFGAVIQIAGPTNKTFWVDVGIRALECVRDPICSEWYPDHWVDALELGMAGRQPHFLYGEYAFYQYLVHGGDRLDATPNKPNRPHYWLIDYCIERLR